MSWCLWGEGSVYELVPLGGGVSVQAGAFGGRGQCMSWYIWGEGSVYKLVPLGGGVSV